MNTRRLLAALCTAALAGAIPAVAKQTDPAPASKAAPANTVSGVAVPAPQKPDPLVDPAVQFVRQNLPQGEMSEQIPRFHDEICAQVIGLPAEFNAFIKARIVSLAHEVGAPVAKSAACASNVHVIFSRSPQAQIDDIAKRREILLGFYWPSQSKQQTAFKGPVQAWYVTRVRDGTDGRSHLELRTPPPSSILDAISNPDRPHGLAGSRLSNGMSAELVHTLVLADAEKVSDSKIGTVADYVSVLALARWRNVDRCHSAVDSVLSSLAYGCETEGGPETATPADIALLKALYAVDPRESGTMQRASIASAVRKTQTASQEVSK
jgi:hypothetical protein